MTFRQRLTAVFSGQRPDRVPYCADLTYWLSAQQEQGTLPERYEGPDGYLRLHQDYGLGVYLYAPPVYRGTQDERVRIESRGDGLNRSQALITPVGTLESQMRYCRESCSWAFVDYGVKRAEDLRVVRYVAEAMTIEPCSDDFVACDARWGEDGLPVALTPRTPLASLVVEWAGLETTSYLVADAPDEVERTLEVLRASQDPIFAAIEASPAWLVEIPDNLSGEMVARLFRDYSLDYYAHRLAGLHAAGKRVGVHLDGTMTGLIDVLAEVGLDFIESITPAPVGDLPIEALRPLVGPKLVLWGGIPGAMYSPLFPHAALRDHLRQVLATEGQSGRLVLASADQIPPDAEMERIREIGAWIAEAT